MQMYLRKGASSKEMTQGENAARETTAASKERLSAETGGGKRDTGSKIA